MLKPLVASLALAAAANAFVAPAPGVCRLHRPQTAQSALPERLRATGRAAKQRAKGLATRVRDQAKKERRTLPAALAAGAIAIGGGAGLRTLRASSAAGGGAAPPAAAASRPSARAAARKKKKAQKPTEVAWSRFEQDVESGRVSKLRIGKTKWDYLGADGTSRFQVRPVALPPTLAASLRKAGVEVASTRKSGSALQAFMSLLWLGALYATLARTFQGGVGQAGSRAKRRDLPPTLGFDAVAGVDAARAEVAELVTMMKDPARYARLGARPPRGILLVGPPGTGKTLLARAMAAEAKVPFIYASGAEFVEMFIGRGAARVRSLFKRAQKASPSILFIDEIDALGKQRSQGFTFNNDEVEQTLNQLLASMDGVVGNKNVLVVAATNRFEILDKALTRPGRFDRIVKVELPDKKGRVDILRVHTRLKALGGTVDLDAVAGVTGGMSGAELEALVNEATIRAVRRQGSAIEMPDMLSAVDSFYSSRGRAPDLVDSVSSLVNSLKGKR